MRYGRVVKFIGPLHGVPVLLKDNVGTEPSMRMENTGGNLALSTSTAIENAPIVDRLLDAGAIILGKTTLSEMMYFKGPGIWCGWSALHGQSLNPYFKGGIDMKDGPGGHSSPGGFSSGSGIAVAAGWAPMAIGTETEGSLNSPSARQSLYTIKPTLGTVPNAGILPVSYYLDVAGPMCSCVQYTADLLTALMGNDKHDGPEGGYVMATKGADGCKELRIGALAPEKFRHNLSFQTPNLEAIEQIRVANLKGYDRIQQVANGYHYDVSLRLDMDFDFEGSNPFLEVMEADLEPDLDEYLANTQGSSITSTKKLAAWDEAHSDVALTPDFITRSIASERSSNRREKLMQHILKVGKSLPDTLEKYNIDVVIGPSDSGFTKYSATTGFPLCTLPLGYIAYNGRPIGLTAMARSESTLVTSMGAFEATFPARQAPVAFLSHRREEE
ncbi:amidase signature enzyme [Ophiobolus disseminans]|uniref:Amidase signature enzyme n=1 Tax=Ophiobolus disseminans TaxID=1469910 RepID=A0A6A7AL71_9PLEO|nr:amidase signature enzyme [Ophiobolus disseminans]